MSIYFVFLLVLCTLTGVHSGRVLLTLYALDLGARPFAVGILVACFSVLPMLLSWQIGRITDRFGSRWPLLFGAAGGACGMLVPYFVPGLPALYAAAVLNGLLFAFSAVSLQAVVGLLSRPEKRTINFSNFTLMASAATFLGPLISGFSIDRGGHSAAALGVAGILLLPVFLLALWGRRLPRGTGEAPPAAGVREMLTGSGLWRVLATGSLMISGISLFQFYMPIYGHSIGLSASLIGILLSVFSAAAFIVRLLMPLLLARWQEERTLVYAFSLATVSLILLPFLQDTLALMAVSFILGLGLNCGQPITMMLTFSSSAGSRSGEVLGLRITANHLTRLIVPTIFGAVGSAFGVFPVFWLNALMMATGGGLTRAGLAGRAPDRR
jgi:MFS family permease